MPDDMAYKILEMRSQLCSWAHVMERFGGTYTTVNGLRGALKRWAYKKDLEIGWAFPRRKGTGWRMRIAPPANWKQALSS